MTAKSLQVAPKLALPLDFATESIGVMGQRGSGKSNALVVEAEAMYDAEIPWFAIDPKGDWWGIQSSADGEGEGLSVPVFGGLHGNAPLEAGMGVAIADLLFDENLTAVLDVSRLTGGELGRFLIDFCHRLFRRHQEEPTVRHGFLEEAHRYIPQQGITGQMAQVKEACAKLPLEGRAFGLGTSTATQRPARLHKDVTTQFGTIVVGRVMAKQDRDAIAGWFKENEVGDDALATLQTLKPGEMWTLSPLLGIFERTTWRQRRTFDSGATPKVGQAKRVPKRLADVDMGAIKDQLHEAIERAEANDPKALRRQLQLAQSTVAQQARTIERLEAERGAHVCDDGRRVEVVKPEDLETFTRLAGVIAAVAPTLEDLVDRMKEAVVDGGQDVPRARQAGGRVVPMERERRTQERADPPAGREPRRAPVPRAAQAVDRGELLSGPQRKVMSVLATYGGMSKRRLAMQAGYSAKGGAFNNTLSSLRSSGCINRGDPIEATELGLRMLGDFEPLPRGQALIDHWLASLTVPQAKILRQLIDRGEMDKARLAEVCGYEPTGGAFNNNLSALRTLELITRGQPIALTEDFLTAINA